MIVEKAQKKDLIRRLKIIEGHAKKVTEMVANNEYCIDILQQTAAVKNSLKKVESLLLANHLHSCLIDAIKENKSNKAIAEVLTVFKRSNN